ncbi:hypothetical protein KAU45_07905 [bacterium]|nr:hypothetical protein [bacterium]
MKDKPIKAIRLLCTILIFAGCDLLTGTGQTDVCDWDWAQNIADDLVRERYSDGLIKYEFEANYLDCNGHLYGGVQHPFWHIVYTNPNIVYGPDVHVIVHPDGATTTFEERGWLNTRELNYASSDVEDWLFLAINCYRYITGRDDDVCYGLRCYASYFYENDYAHITLYNSNIEELASVTINIDDGIVEDFDLKKW